MITEDDLKVITQFVREAYKCNRSSNMNDARFDVITHNKVKTFREVPPSKSAILFHSQRAAYVAGHLWGQAATYTPCLPPFSEWGWNNHHNQLIPIWTDKQDIKAYDKLLRSCKCSKGCLTVACKCSDTTCLSFCVCRGECLKDVEDSDIEDDSETDG